METFKLFITCVVKVTPKTINFETVSIKQIAFNLHVLIHYVYSISSQIIFIFIVMLKSSLHRSGYLFILAGLQKLFCLDHSGLKRLFGKKVQLS